MKRPNPATARSWSARHHRRLPGRPSTWAPLSPNDALVDRCLLLLALQAGHVLGQVIDGQYPRKLHVLDLAVAVAEGGSKGQGRIPRGQRLAGEFCRDGLGRRVAFGSGR
eukprot:883950-Prymnesium_polylepis.1